MLWRKKEIIFVSPVKGKLIPLSQTPDEAFASKKFGSDLLLFLKVIQLLLQQTV